MQHFLTMAILLRLLILLIIPAAGVLLGFLIKIIFKRSLEVSLAIGICAVMAGVSIYFFSVLREYFYREECVQVAADNFHYFHDHLTSLCVNREDLAECPKDASQLEAFNPQKWDAVQTCGQVQYSFDENKYNFEITNINGATYRASTDLKDGFKLEW